MKNLKKYKWAVVGAGPAGMTVVGQLLDNGIKARDILWLDPSFNVGDFGSKWGEVSSNTTVELFLRFLNDIQAFEYAKKAYKFAIDDYAKQGFTQLKDVSEPLQWITKNLLQKVDYSFDTISSMKIAQGVWNLYGTRENYIAEKVVLATGSLAKSLNIHNFEITKEILLAKALAPSKLKNELCKGDNVAVFGSSHSAMIIIRNLLELGVEDVANFYQQPLRYAVNMGDWTLYDNSGLKGETAKWVRENISQNLDSRVKRYLSTDEEINKHLHKYTKVIYAVGFEQRVPSVEGIDVRIYDPTTGIIAPGLFGAGIAFPRRVTDPNGNVELNVGLFKFMKDIRHFLPLWLNYDI
ncbi:FAD-dependent oxidoreductase [Francisella sp. TX07-6608]|uniref:FAD-dependent oxidoreductase n=1 Tax=Francisella sp. TX07-6608 TaxID=573568 RepID=UPI0008F9D57E|nr:FAD-dependent oxidoreductase [Francisella sp. TX07-6608]OIN83322.1 pyridine nucleotide-disulfide oxidoreductase family protein [Francisella sp. TX07-6608]